LKVEERETKMSLKDLLKEITATGPDNMKRILAMIEKLPSDDTLHELNATANKLIPLIPQLENILGSGNLDKLMKLTGNIPDTDTLNRLASALPALEKLPDKKTLGELMKKAESLSGFLDSL